VSRKRRPEWRCRDCGAGWTTEEGRWKHFEATNHSVYRCKTYIKDKVKSDPWANAGRYMEGA
jgi:hypothetical protein